MIKVEPQKFADDFDVVVAMDRNRVVYYYTVPVAKYDKIWNFADLKKQYRDCVAGEITPLVHYPKGTAWRDSLCVPRRLQLLMK